MRRIALVLYLLAAPLGAQGVTKDAPVRSDEERAVLAVLEKLFDAMRAGDSAAVRAIVHPQATLFRMLPRNGVPTFVPDSIDVFVRAIGRPRAEAWDERTANEHVHIDAGLATVWNDYWFFVGSRFSHCGVDSFQLVKMPDGWKIASIADTQRREGCPPAPARKP